VKLPRTILLCSTLMAAAPMGANDDRLATVDYRPGETVELNNAPGGSLAIFFSTQERIERIEAADPEAFEFVAQGNNGTLFVRTLRQPANGQVNIKTNLYEYRLALKPAPSDLAVYALRFNYGGATAQQAISYKISGEPALRPSRISDDGARMYLEWPEDQPLPAVFALNAFGVEEIVDGYMRNGIFTIDRVHRELVFRIGKRTAAATRMIGEKRKR
jgi:type IV secretion system protein VirB9